MASGPQTRYAESGVVRVHASTGSSGAQEGTEPATRLRPYYESWTAALESLVLSLGLATEDALDAAAPSERAPL